ncbi:MAG: class I SAM-dependent methyltransferase [Mycobacterium sp.]|nr:class I SAM-dependent methyltransferase [Mycobacterium sp.]
MDRFGAYVSILESQGIAVSASTKILDFGCGDGGLVKSAISRGLDAYGCDIDFSQVWLDQELLAGLVQEGRVRKIEAAGRDNPHYSPLSADAYRLPFDDATFDIVVSDQVLEHVFNYSEVAHELYRVLKPGGVFLHMFPSSFSIIEPHINVPFAGAFDSNWWLRLWAVLGVRNIYQKDFSVKETVSWNREFLDKGTNYLSKRQLREDFINLFEVRFLESEFLKTSKRARVFLLPSVYSCLRSRVMYGVRRNK